MSFALENQVEQLKEELECIHMYLDDMEAPRKKPSYEDGYKGEMRDLSIVGRVKSLIECDNCKREQITYCGVCDNDE